MNSLQEHCLTSIFHRLWWVLKTIVTIINTDSESRSILIYIFFIIWWPLNFTTVGLLKTIVDWNKRYCHHLLAIPLFLCRRRRIKAFFRKTSFSLIIRERNQIARLKKNWPFSGFPLYLPVKKLLSPISFFTRIL